MSDRFLLRFLLWAVALAVVGSPALHSQSPEGTSSSSSASSQAAPPLPSAPTPSRATTKQKPTEDGAYEHLFHGNVSCGVGPTLQSGGIATPSVGMCGAGITIIPGVVTEVGVTGPENGSPHFYVSEDFIAPLTPTLKRLHGAPLGVVGYTKMVGNSNRFNFGLGWDHHLGNGNSLAFELRDYLQFSSPAVQHTILLRVSLAAGGDWD